MKWFRFSKPGTPFAECNKTAAELMSEFHRALAKYMTPVYGDPFNAVNSITAFNELELASVLVGELITSIGFLQNNQLEMQAKIAFRHLSNAMALIDSKKG